MSATADTLVETDLERCFLDQLRDATGEVDGPMERHCVRCFLFMELPSNRRGLAIDRELALCGAFVHDIGLYTLVTRVSRRGTYRVISGLVGHALLERPVTVARIFKTS